jgi:hypothetical protein
MVHNPAAACSLCALSRLSRGPRRYGTGALPTYSRYAETLRETFALSRAGYMGTQLIGSLLLRTPQTQVHTRHRHHLRRSTRRTTAPTSLALRLTYKPSDTYTPAYQRSDRSESHPLLSLHHSRT